MEKIKVLIADDHQLFKEGLKSLLVNAEDIAIVGETSNGQEVLEIVETQAVDVVLLDIDMPVLNGIETTKQLVKNFPQVNVLILTTHEQKYFIQQLKKIGAKGYLLKNIDYNTLHLAIQTVAKGDFFFNDFNDFEKEEFSDQEIIILKYIAEGLPNKLIADKLFLSPRTIDTYRANIMKKLQVHNTAELIAHCLKAGLI